MKIHSPLHYQYEITLDEYIDGLVQERHNTIANALELRLSCTNPSMCQTNKLIVAEWRIYVSVRETITGPDNGLSPGRRLTIIWTNA